MLDISPRVSPEVQRKEARQLAETFLARWHGTEQATRIWLWSEWRAGSVADPPSVAPEPPRVVERCRQRLERVLDALAADQ
jgi:hypothetical protein